MESIRSGTTTERVIRTSILTMVLVGYSLWSFRDGYYAYPRENLERLVQNLHPVPAPKDYPEINPQVTRATFGRMRAMMGRGQNPTEQEVGEMLGDPGVRQGDASFYFGPGGLARIVFKNGTVQRVGVEGNLESPRWFPGVRSEGDIRFNKVVGVLVGVFGLLMVLQWVRVLSTRVELSDAGLKVSSQGGLRFGGSPLIPFDAMKKLRDPNDGFKNKKKDFVELDYELADGRQGSVRLNIYAHKAFREIMAEICRRCGFDNPLQSEDKSEPAATGEAEVGSPAEPGSPEPQQGGPDQAG